MQEKGDGALQDIWSVGGRFAAVDTAAATRASARVRKTTQHFMNDASSSG